jgi:hypothetical protein
VTKFGTTDAPLTDGEVLLSSRATSDDVVPAETTVRLAPAD